MFYSSKKNMKMIGGAIQITNVFNAEKNILGNLSAAREKVF